MSQDKTITSLERDARESIPSIAAFKRRMQHLLLNNRYTATFGGGAFWSQYSNYVQYMVSQLTIPNWTIDNENIYMGGANMVIPNGFQQNNIELTLYNTGPELYTMQKWLSYTYDQKARTYGYFDDIKGDLEVIQYTTDGKKAQTFIFYDCTIFQINGISYSYEPATAPQTFSVSLYYYGFDLKTENWLTHGALGNKVISNATSKTGLRERMLMLQETRSKDAGVPTGGGLEGKEGAMKKAERQGMGAHLRKLARPEDM